VVLLVAIPNNGVTMAQGGNGSRRIWKRHKWSSYFDPATNYLLLEQWLGLLVAMRVITSSSSGDQIQTRRQQVGLDLYLLI
jgi:hypothetical protein